MALNACSILDIPEFEDLSRSTATIGLCGLAWSISNLDIEIHPMVPNWAKIFAEAALSLGPDQGHIKQAEATLKRVEQLSSVIEAEQTQELRAFKDGIRFAIGIHRIGPSRSYVSRSTSIQTLLHHLQNHF